ncbi:TSUP family transporter [Streptomyces microflavus]|uniref:TSUP family transporter n=1 Tax=Streptomyces microflavus TaxID=1919 RepID=UPI0037D70A3A
MIVAVVGVVGGGVNSLFGGGTLITFPALTILGIPAVNANITNTVATIPGYASGAWEQRTELRTQRRRVAVVAVPAVAGGLIGGLLLLHTSASAFEAVIPWLILITSVLLALQPQLKDHVARCLSAHHHRTSPPGASMRKLALVGAYAFLGSPYGGLFGAGLGVVMLTLFSFVLPDALTRINALKQNETHFAPLLRIQGEVNGVALELKASDGTRLPVLVTSTVKRDEDGQPILIRTTVLDARDRRTYERELLRARRDAEHDRERLQRLATTLQRTLLPPAIEPVPGMEAAAHYHFASSDEVGGDFYDLFPLAAGGWGFFMGDVRGKGADAAVVTSLARYTLRAAAVSDPVPVRVLANLNTALNHQVQEDDPLFCTVIFGLLTPAENDIGFHIVLAGGGHPPAVLLQADGSADYLNTPGGQLVGVVPDAHFTTLTLDLRPGDTLLLYTDGLTEARTGDPGERYGDEALLDFVRSLAPVSASEAVRALTALLDSFGEGLDDDAALLAMSVPEVRRPGRSAAAKHARKTVIRVAGRGQAPPP